MLILKLVFYHSGHNADKAMMLNRVKRKIKKLRPAVEVVEVEVGLRKSAS